MLDVLQKALAELSPALDKPEIAEKLWQAIRSQGYNLYSLPQAKPDSIYGGIDPRDE